MKKDHEAACSTFILLDEYLMSEDGEPPDSWVANKGPAGIEKLAAIGIPLSLIMDILDMRIKETEEDEKESVSESETMTDVHDLGHKI
jgi:hypothetical protein